MTAKTQVRLLWTLVGIVSSSLALWVVVVRLFGQDLLCLIGTCEASIRVSGELADSANSDSMECHIQLIAPETGLVAVEPVHGEANIGNRFDTVLQANPHHHGPYQVFVSCPDRRTFTSRVFTLRELAAQQGRLQLGVVTLSRGEPS